MTNPNRTKLGPLTIPLLIILILLTATIVDAKPILTYFTIENETILVQAYSEDGHRPWTQCVYWSIPTKPSFSYAEWWWYEPPLSFSVGQIYTPDNELESWCTDNFSID